MNNAYIITPEEINLLENINEFIEHRHAKKVENIIRFVKKRGLFPLREETKLEEKDLNEQ